jgi:flagellin
MSISIGGIGGARIGAHLSANSQGLARLANRISSGRRVNDAADDAAGLGVATKLDAQVQSTRAAIRNAKDGIALIEVADTAAGEVTDSLQRMRELAVQAGSSFLTSDSRSTLDHEFSGMRSEIARISSSVTFNGVSLLNGSISQLFAQVGIGSASSSRMAIQLGQLTTSALGLGAAGVDLLTATNAQSSLDVIDSALHSVNSTRSKLGATVNRLEASIGATQSFQHALTASSARLLDADIAKETSEFAKVQILMVAGGASLVHQRRIEETALRLLA